MADPLLSDAGIPAADAAAQAGEPSRHRVAFVIPTLNESGRIAALLLLLRERFPGAQRIVIDGGSRDDTIREAMPLAHQLLLGSPGRADQMDLGARAAASDWLVFLHADTTPEFDERELETCLTEKLTWGYCRIGLRGESALLPMIAWFMRRRSGLTHVATGDQTLVIRRSVYLEEGGFAAIPLMEDVEFCKRLRQRASPVALPLVVLSSGRRWDDNGALRTVLLMWRLRLLYVLGVTPERLWEDYYGRGRG